MKIHKAYGPEGAWKKEGDYFINTQKHLISGKNRNHLIELAIPSSKLKLKSETKVAIAKAEVTMLGLKETSFKQVQLEKDLVITVVNEEDKISSDYIDFDVIFNYYRVRSVEVMSRAKGLEGR